MHIPSTPMARVTALVLLALAAGTTLAQSPVNVLATSPAGTVTAADYEASIQRIPENDRFGFAMSQDRINKEIEGIIRFRTIAAEARKQGLDKDPLIRNRVNLYEERLLAEALFKKIDAESTKDFEAKMSSFVDRAREQYLLNKQNFQIPAEVKAAHILVKTDGRTSEEALAKITALRQKIVAGASFNDVAAAESDDPTARETKGELGFFGKGQMDPAFEAAAFALSKPGDISQPVRSRFGYHLIRLEEIKPGRLMTFDEAKPGLLEKLKASHLEMRQFQAVQGIYDPSKVVWNEPAVVALRKTVAPAIYKSLEK